MNQLDREQYISELFTKQQSINEIEQMAKDIEKPQVNPKISALAEIRQKRARNEQFKPDKKDYSEEDEKSKSEESEYDESGDISDQKSVGSEDEGEKKPGREHKSTAIQLVDIEKVRLSRDMLEKWVDQVYFEQTVKNCFVRTTVGASQNQHQYKMCQVEGVVNDPSSTYKLGQKQTTKLLKVKYGSSIKTMPMNVISNSPFAETEFFEWKRVMEKDGLPLVTKEMLLGKQNDIHRAQNYLYKPEEIDDMVIRNRKERLEKHESRINVVFEINQVDGQIQSYQKLIQELENEKNTKKDKSGQIAKFKSMLEMLKDEKKMLDELLKNQLNEAEVQDTMTQFNLRAKLNEQKLDSLADTLDSNDKAEAYNPFARRTKRAAPLWNTKLDAKPEEKQNVTPKEKTPKAVPQKNEEAKKEQENSQNYDEETRKKVLIAKHKEIKLDIDNLIIGDIENSKSEIGMFDMKYKPMKNMVDPKNETMVDQISFGEWKNKYLNMK